MPSSRPRPTRRALLRALGGLAVAAPLAVSCGSSAPDAVLRPVAHWRRAFEAATGDLEYYERLSSSSDSQDHYHLAYGVDAYTMMFEAGGDVSCLDAALRLVENVVERAEPSSSFATSSFGDDYLTWVSAGDEVPLHQSYLWRYVLRTLRVLRGESALMEEPAWQARYARLLAFSERNVFDKWTRRGLDAYVYRDRTHMAAHWAFIGMNLARLTDDRRRRALARQVKDAVDDRLPNHPSSLRQQLRDNPSDARAYGWSSVWGNGPGEQTQDVSHGNNVVAYVVEARDLDDGWTTTDIARFVRTLDPVVWPPDGDAVAEDVDGNGEGVGWLSDGFAKLGRHDAALQERLQTHDVRDAQFLAAMAVNAAALGRS